MIYVRLSYNGKYDKSSGIIISLLEYWPKQKAKVDVTTGKVVSSPKIPFIHPKIKDESNYVVKVEGKGILLESTQFL